MNQENQLTEQNSEETEIDLLEIFYLLRANRLKVSLDEWLMLLEGIRGSGCRLHHTFSDHTKIYGNCKNVYDFRIQWKCA